MFNRLIELFYFRKKTPMINLILFGPPGSGKGTQAAKLAEKYNLIHISTGDLFRYEMGNNTPLGMKAKEYIAKGELVPDSITVGMLENKLDKHPKAAGFILDGFPRTIAQSEALDQIFNKKNMAVSKLIALDVAEEELVTRLKGRAKTSGRADDADEGIIRNRIKVYHEETSPVFDYYDKQDLSHKINGVGTVEDIFSRLCESIDALS